MRKAHLGQIAWNKGKKTGLVPKSAFKKGGISPRKGVKLSRETIQKFVAKKKGFPLLKNRGKRHWNWKGGMSRSEDKIFRQSLEYKMWRESVFKRDNYQCVWGGKEHGSKLNADHIKRFSQFPELRLDVNNGRTLCVDCHKTTETYGGKK